MSNLNSNDVSYNLQAREITTMVVSSVGRSPPASEAGLCVYIVSSKVGFLHICKNLYFNLVILVLRCVYIFLVVDLLFLTHVNII